MKKHAIRSLCLLLCLLTALLPLAGCKKDTPDDGDGSSPVTRKPNDGTEDQDKMSEHDFEGKIFNIYNSVQCDYSWGSSNPFIEGDESDDSSISAQVFARNSYLIENMNVDFKFINVDQKYDQVTAYYRQLFLNGEEVDLIINKLFPLVDLSLEGGLTNTASNNYFDYFSNYWYTDYMNDLSLDGGNTCYLLAGDYFMDIIRSVNILTYNMDMMNTLNGENGGNGAFISMVEEGNWTIDKMIEFSNAAYSDMDGVSGKSEGDCFGYVSTQIWGAMIPMVSAFGLKYADFEDGNVTLTLNNDRSAKALDNLKALFNGDGSTGYTVSGDLANSDFVNSEDNSLSIFMNGNALFAGELRFASMSILTAMEGNWSVLPYPKLDDTQTSYISPTHDTTEVGAIPRICSNKDDVLQLLEYLSLLTSRTVMTEYYDTLLKNRYSKVPEVQKMVTIIHDNLGGAFVVGYNNATGNGLLWEPFYQPLIKNRDFSAYYPTYSSPLKGSLETILSNWERYME